MTQTDLFTRLAPFGFDSGANFSADHRYRYRLWRSWGDRERRVCFVMLNPSSADDVDNDPTIRKCIGFAKRWGYEAIDVVNLFAFRSPYPRDLRYARDPVGPENDEAIRRATVDAVLIVLAWGTHRPIRGLLEARRVDANAVILGYATASAKTLGRCADGNPRHPLMLAYSTPLEDA